MGRQQENREHGRTVRSRRFEKGHAKVGGRKKGTPNAATRDLRQAIINAAIRLGEDGKGKDGLEGFMVMLAREEKKIFGTLLRGVLPMQINTSISTVVNVQYKSLDEAIAEARALGLPERRVFELTDYRIQDAQEEPPARE